MESIVPAPSAKPPRITVIVPVRNDPARLGKCLAALHSSQFTDFEVIVVDDASTDDTPRVAESMGSRPLRFSQRSGAAAARNAGAEIARGGILMFIDADVCVHPDTLAIAAASFDDPSVDAVFGSYDLEPAEPNFLSQYKNLAHRFYHQVSNEEVSTFWSGCGAIRREVFNQFKFDAQRFTRPSIEDIDLGARLTRAGKKIVINKNLQAKHLKHWTLWGIFRSDVRDRAIPWTRLILREEHLPGELNLSHGQRIAALLSGISAIIFLAACYVHPWLILFPIATFAAIAVADRWTGPVSPTLRKLIAAAIIVAAIIFIIYARWWAAAILVPIAIVLLINAPLYRFFIAHRGGLFAVAAVPMHLTYYLYSMAAFAIGNALHFADTTERLDDFANRVRFYVKLTIVLYAIAWALVLIRGHVRHTTVDFAVSDATGYYVYLPAMVIDHDLQFEKQLEDQFHSDETKYDADAMKHNRWPIGVALSIAPAFLVAHGLSLLLFHWSGWAIFQPHGYSAIYYVLCVAWAMAIGTAGMICIDRLMSERFAVRGRIVFAAVMTTWLGTNFLWYYVREPLLSHMLGAAWVSFCVYLIHRIETNSRDGKIIWWQLPLLAFVASMALVCRMTNAFMLPMFVYLLIVLVRRKVIPRAAKLLPLILVALAPLVIQIVITNLLMKPHNIATTQDTIHRMGYAPKEQFYWTQPALLRSLFSSRHGLFFGTPTLLLAAWGLIWHLLRRGGWRDPLLACFVGSALLLWYINSAWYAWWFGPSVGNRGYVELAGLFTIGFAFAFVWLANLRPRSRRVILIACAIALAMNYLTIGLKMTHLVGDNQSLIPLEDRILTGSWKRI